MGKNTQLNGLVRQKDSGNKEHWTAEKHRLKMARKERPAIVCVLLRRFNVQFMLKAFEHGHKYRYICFVLAPNVHCAFVFLQCCICIIQRS